MYIRVQRVGKAVAYIEAPVSETQYALARLNKYLGISLIFSFEKIVHIAVMSVG